MAIASNASCLHPEEVRARRISYKSFFLGADLYVAPVLDLGRLAVEVYFPDRIRHTHVWSGGHIDEVKQRMFRRRMGNPQSLLWASQSTMM